jgi:hypothetical protein
LTQVVGNATALVQSEDWKALLADAKARGAIVETSTCVAQGLLPESSLGSSVAPQAGQGLLRHARAGVLPSGRLESPSTNGSSQFTPGNLQSAGRQQDDVPTHGGESERWPGSAYRGSRLHRDGSRPGFNQRNLPSGRSFGGRGSNGHLRRGKG